MQFFPSLHHHLAGCFNDFPSVEQPATKETLQRCDEDVGKLTLQIRSTQMATIQKNQAQMERWQVTYNTSNTTRW
jgi:hypothetical protein